MKTLLAPDNALRDNALDLAPQMPDEYSYYFENGFYSHNSDIYPVRSLADAARDNPTMVVPLFKLSHQLFEKVWRDELKPMTVVSIIMAGHGDGKYKDHIDRIRCADMAYPIMIDEQYNILDGFHRLAKYFIKSQLEVKCVMISDDQLAAVVNND